MRLADVGHVARHLAEQRRRDRHLRLDVELGRDQLGGADERVALAEREVDRLVRDAAVDERLDPARDPVDAVVDVGEVEHLVGAAEDRDRLVARHRVDEERQHARHPVQVVVVAPVDVREAEGEVPEAVAARVGVDERLARDLRGGVRALREGEVGRLLAVALEAVDVAVHLARRGEDERQPALPAVLEHVEGHHRVLERAVRLRDELVHLRVRRQVDDDVGLGVRDAADPVREGRVLARQVLDQVAEVVRPGVHALVDAEDLVAVGEEPQGEVGADLPGRAREQDLHAATAVRCAPRSVVEVAPSIRTSTSSPGSALAGEVDGHVAARAAAQERRVGAARALDEHLLDAADARRRSARPRSAGRRRPAARAARA